MVDVVAEFGTVADAMGEEAGELLHFADGVGHFGGEQAAEIAAEQVVAIDVSGLGVAASGEVVGDLAEDPGIGGCGAADHDGVAIGFGDHAHGVLRSANVAIADDRNFYGGFYVTNHVPVSGAGVA